MQKLNRDLKENTLEQIYLLYGDEPFLLASYKKRLKAAMAGDDEMNSSYYEGKGIDLGQVKSMAETLPFFADRRLIILENSGLMKGASDGWVELLDHLPESTSMVFVETEVDKRSRMYKKVKEKSFCPLSQERYSSTEVLVACAACSGAISRISLNSRIRIAISTSFASIIWSLQIKIKK